MPRHFLSGLEERSFSLLIDISFVENELNSSVKQRTVVPAECRAYIYTYIYICYAEAQPTEAEK